MFFVRVRFGSGPTLPYPDCMAVQMYKMSLETNYNFSVYFCNFYKLFELWFQFRSTFNPFMHGVVCCKPPSAGFCSLFKGNPYMKLFQTLGADTPKIFFSPKIDIQWNMKMFSHVTKFWKIFKNKDVGFEIFKKFKY